MTDNAQKQAQTKINRQNADAKSIGVELNKLAVIYGDRVDTTAGDAAVTEIKAQVVILDAQADITFPVVKLEADTIIPVKVPLWGSIPDVSYPQGATWDIDMNDYVEGDAPITFAVTTGALPTGITLNTDGTFSGTVTNAAGSGTFAVTATNSFGATESAWIGWAIV